MDDDYQVPCSPVDGALPVTRRCAPLQWNDGEATHIDVRGLPPPQPLVAILRLVHSLADGDAGGGAPRPRSGDAVSRAGRGRLGAERIDGPAGEVRLLLRRTS